MKKLTAIATAFSLCVILIFSITTHSAGSEISADSQAIEIIPVSMPVVTYIPIEEISESRGRRRMRKRKAIGNRHHTQPNGFGAFSRYGL